MKKTLTAAPGAWARVYLACLACVAWLAGAGVASAVAAETPVATVPALDVPRYMGTWYEIAKFPNTFQRKCVAATTASYTLRADGKVGVVNRCQVKDGGMIEAEAEARQQGPASSPRLKVRFAPAWLSALPWVWADYWVIDLDKDYQLAAVGEPRREYLWILSRTPTVTTEAYESLVDRLTRQGFDTSKLERTPQGGPAAIAAGRPGG